MSRSLHMIILPFLILLVSSAFAAASADQKLPASFTSGFFYTSTVVNDGVVQLSSCAPDGQGYRCSVAASQNLTFLFQDVRACELHHKHLLSSEEE